MTEAINRLHAWIHDAADPDNEGDKEALDAWAAILETLLSDKEV